MTLSLPSTGVYLRLLTEARAHLLYLLKQISPRHREATAALLSEKWSGNVLGDPISQVKRARGDWSGVLPGKTKRWRDFYGMRFEWILAECVGAGLCVGRHDVCAGRILGHTVGEARRSENFLVDLQSDLRWHLAH